MADKITPYIEPIPTRNIGQAIEDFVMMASSQRKGFERRWYNNNFFDDGYHFRFLSRTTGRIVDLENKNIHSPERAIPKASRQIRGIANLLMQLEPVPVVYPEKVTKASFAEEKMYVEALNAAKEIAKKSGHWIREEFKNQEMIDKLTLMIILAAKHGISYLEVWPDAVEEKIKTQIYDAFDIYLLGNLTEISDSPMIVKAIPQLISVIKANENFDPDQLNQISPDNRYASSEIKQAYLQSRYGQGITSDSAATLILKEAFIKEYLNADNMAQAASDLEGNFGNRKKGDVIIRQVFCAGGVWLRDKYIDLPEAPFIDYRFEPGPIYQVPLIERFIPANKSLDTVMSRLERFINTMTVGIYQKRKNENFDITNLSGAQVIEYETTPLAQMNMASPPPYIFNFISELNQIIEEQGASTSALNQLPTGVKSGIAIESVKATEFANLKIATNRLKLTVKHFAEKLLDIADNQFVTPQTVMLLEKGEPQYFDVIGKSAIEKRKGLKIGTPEDVVPLSKEYRVDIQIESGMGFTEEGRRTTMKQILDFLIQIAQAGYITQEAVKAGLMKFLDTFGYGSLQDFQEAMEKGTQGSPLSDEQLMQIKVALLEAMKESGEIGPEASQKRIMENKVGTLEAMNEAGLTGNGQQDKTQDAQQPKAPSESISFKDLPPSGKTQMAAKVGINISPEEIANQELVNKKSVQGGSNAINAG